MQIDVQKEVAVVQDDARLSAQPSLRIDLNRPLQFTFDGNTYTAYEGDTIASALWAAGVRLLSRSFKYHRPRGPFALTSGDSNTLVQVDGEPNVRASTRQVEEGMVVEPQNVWPSLNRDLLSLTELGARFLPVGFYYKAFMWPQRLWPQYEKVLRTMAGLGAVTPEESDRYYDKKYEFADVLVIGGGPAGMSAALGAAENGARVLLLDENSYLGGHLTYERQSVPDTDARCPAHELAQCLARRVAVRPNIRVCLNTTAFGVYDHLWVGAAQDDRRLLKIRAKSLVVASGAFEQPFIFENNDRPGVLLGSAAQRLMHVYGVRPGQRAVVLSANRDGLQAALDLHAAGVQVPLVVELRDKPDADLRHKLETAGMVVRNDCLVTKATGRPTLDGVVLQQVRRGRGAGGAQVLPGQRQEIECDLLVSAVGWTPATGLLYQAGARMAYDDERAEFLPAQFPTGVYAAGRVTGAHAVGTELLEGKLAGLEAAAHAGFEGSSSSSPEQLRERVARRKAQEPMRTSSLIYAPGDPKKSFISFDEDVTVQDLRDSVAEGYASMELLKRYSTLSMGPSQGKYENANTMALCAEANDQTIPETGTTTSRPPFSPVPLGVLAARIMEPVKETPMHEWHVRQKSTMMNAGLWKRPEHYGDPVAEVRGTRDSLGIIDVSTLGKMQVHGPDAPALLERLYTNKWRKLSPGRVRYGVMCNEEGIVTNDGVAARLDEQTWYVTATTSGITALYENIEWNLQSGWDLDVHVANVTDAYAAMNLTGPRARQALQPLTSVDLSNEAFPYMHVRQGTVAGVPVRLLRIGFTGELGYEIHAPAGYGLYLWETLLEAGQPFGITPFGVEAQRIMRLEKGHFIVGQDTDGLTDPLMAGLDWAVKLDKADFLGKPSLVRIRKRGVTQRLVGYEMVEDGVVPEEANQIVVPNAQEPLGLQIIGRITSSRYSPTLEKAIGLCWLPVELSAPGSEFAVRVRGELHKGRVARLPFYDPESERLKS